MLPSWRRTHLPNVYSIAAPMIPHVLLTIANSQLLISSIRSLLSCCSSFCIHYCRSRQCLSAVDIYPYTSPIPEHSASRKVRSFTLQQCISRYLLRRWPCWRGASGRIWIQWLRCRWRRLISIRCPCLRWR